ncbi:MAG: LacI family DNA-binding transcriptional regulator, partial [Candidatus Omnitrophica bacterium]|nr:LacI family DNA-binding transcriptional regulator [Candidatus Omnitrophota bacterium]
MLVKNEKISIEDVARRAKVSITTVSRVINKVPTVSKENVARVE